MVYRLIIIMENHFVLCGDMLLLLIYFSEHNSRDIMCDNHVSISIIIAVMTFYHNVWLCNIIVKSETWSHENIIYSSLTLLPYTIEL